MNQNNPTLKNLSSLLSPLFGNIKRDPERVRDHIKRKLNIGIEKFKRGEGPLNAFLNLFNNPVQAYQPSPTFSRVGIPLNNPEPACENPQPPKRQHDHSDSESEEGKGKKKIKEDLKD